MLRQQNVHAPRNCQTGPPGCDASALAVPLGGVARQGPATLLPEQLGIRGYMSGSSLVLWVLQGYTVTHAGALTLQYALPQHGIRAAPRFQDALLYPPRSLVQHGAITYQNLTSDDLTTPPPRGWTRVNAPVGGPVLQCTAAVALCLRHGRAQVCSQPAVPVPGTLPPSTDYECLLPAEENDDIYAMQTDAREAGDTVMALWQLKVPAPSHVAVLVPSMAHRCRISVRFPSAPPPPVDLTALVQPIERIKRGSKTLWWSSALECYCHADGEAVEVLQVAEQLGVAAYHGTRVVQPDGIWTQESPATIRTEVHLGLLPAAASLPHIRLRLPIPLLLQQVPVPSRPSAGRFLLVAHGHVLAGTQPPVTHECRPTADWYSYAQHMERLAWDDQDPGVLWVVHRPEDPPPCMLWVSDNSWVVDDEWVCEEDSADDFAVCPPEHAVVAAVAQAQQHRREMLCRMWEEGPQEPNALLLLLCTLDDDVPWQTQSAALLQHWPLMRPVTANRPLLQQVLQLLQHMVGQPDMERSEVTRTQAPPPPPFPARPVKGWRGGRLATVGRQGTASLTEQRRSPWVRHLGADYNRLQQLLTQAEPPASGPDAELHRHLHASFSGAEG